MKFRRVKLCPREAVRPTGQSEEKIKDAFPKGNGNRGTETFFQIGGGGYIADLLTTSQIPAAVPEA